MAKSEARGFTLIELLVVIAIIGLLSSILLSALQSAKLKAQSARRAETKQTVINALTLFNIDNGSWIVNNGDWVCLAPTGVSCWNGAHPGSSNIWNQFAPYFNNTPPLTNTTQGNFAYNYYIYSYPQTLNGQTGAFFVWPKDSPITSGECPPPSFNAGKIDSYWYCYYYLGK